MTARIPNMEHTLGDVPAWVPSPIVGLCERCGALYLVNEPVARDGNGAGYVAQACCGPVYGPEA